MGVTVVYRAAVTGIAPPVFISRRIVIVFLIYRRQPQCDDSKNQSIIQINHINPNPMMSVLRVLKLHFQEKDNVLKRKLIENPFDEDNNESLFEICILCGKLTHIPKQTPIVARQGYFEGAGQLCSECHHKIKEKT